MENIHLLFMNQGRVESTSILAPLLRERTVWWVCLRAHLKQVSERTNQRLTECYKPQLQDIFFDFIIFFYKLIANSEKAARKLAKEEADSSQCVSEMQISRVAVVTKRDFLPNKSHDVPMIKMVKQ